MKDNEDIDKFFGDLLSDDSDSDDERNQLNNSEKHQLNLKTYEEEHASLDNSIHDTK